MARPPKYKTAADMQKAIDAWLQDIRDRDTMNPTITGLAFALGFCSRQSIYDYEDDPKFSYTIKKAKLFIEYWYEQQLMSNHVTGAIFALKNLGWKDSQDVVVGGNMGVIFRFDGKGTKTKD